MSATLETPSASQTTPRRRRRRREREQQYGARVSGRSRNLDLGAALACWQPKLDTEAIKFLGSVVLEHRPDPQQRDEGRAELLVSFAIEEIQSLSDRRAQHRDDRRSPDRVRSDFGAAGRSCLITYFPAARSVQHLMHRRAPSATLMFTEAMPVGRREELIMGTLTDHRPSMQSAETIFSRVFVGVDGSPESKPVLVAASADADLLVLGSRGLHGLRSLGSVSERVAHRAECSTMLVRGR